MSEYQLLLENPPHDVDIMLYDKKKSGSHSGDNTVDNSNDGRMTLTKLAIEMRAGFKQVNNRIDKIDARLDYIVKANNLKDRK